MGTGLQLKEDPQKLTVRDFLVNLRDARQPYAQLLFLLAKTILASERQAVATEYVRRISDQDPSAPILAIIANNLAAGKSPEMLLAEMGSHLDQPLQVSAEFRSVSKGIQEATELLAAELGESPLGDLPPLLDALSLIFAVQASGGRDGHAQLLQLINELTERVSPPATMQGILEQSGKHSQPLPKQARPSTETHFTEREAAVGSELMSAFRKYINDYTRQHNILTATNIEVLPLSYALRWIEGKLNVKENALQGEVGKIWSTQMHSRDELTTSSNSRLTDKKTRKLITPSLANTIFEHYLRRMIKAASQTSTNG